MDFNSKISIREYARRLGISDKAVRNAIKTGKIVSGYESTGKQIIPALADKEWGDVHKAKLPVIDYGNGGDEIVTAHSSPSSVPFPDNVGVKNVADAIDKDALLSSWEISSNLTYAEATRRREIIGAALDLRKLQESEGILVRRAEVEKTLFAFGDQLKKALLSIPARIIEDILIAPNKVEAITIIESEIKSVLTQFADLEKIEVVKGE